MDTCHVVDFKTERQKPVSAVEIAFGRSLVYFVYSVLFLLNFHAHIMQLLF